MKKILIMLMLLFSTTVFSNNYTTNITLDDSNYIVLDEDFNVGSVSNLMSKVGKRIAKYPDLKSLYLILYTPGGSVEAGLMLFDNLNSYHVKINTITIFAASMGFQAVQSLGDRYILPHGVLMSHRAKGGFEGEFPNGNLDSRFEFYKKRIHEMDNLAVKRSNGKFTFEEYVEKQRNEIWCSGMECVKEGYADLVANVVCSPTMFGIKEVVKKTNFLGLEMVVKFTKSGCPLILGPVSAEATFMGKTYDVFNDTLDENMRTFIMDTIDPINKLKNKLGK